jgi:hypothetical protein
MTTKTQIGTVRLLPALREDLCCNRCQDKAQALSDWLQLAIMQMCNGSDKGRDAFLADWQAKNRAFYGPL